jgi:2'-5' RNA ligase
MFIFCEVNSDKVIDKIRDLFKQIHKSHLYTDEPGYGLETEPHITVHYGVEETSENIKIVTDIISSSRGPVEVEVTGMGIFENEKFDVLKFNVKSALLEEIHDKIGEQTGTKWDFAEYGPHITVAYLKSGYGKYFVDGVKFSKFTIMSPSLVMRTGGKLGEEKHDTVVSLNNSKAVKRVDFKDAAVSKWWIGKAGESAEKRMIPYYMKDRMCWGVALVGRNKSEEKRALNLFMSTVMKTSIRPRFIVLNRTDSEHYLTNPDKVVLPVDQTNPDSVSAEMGLDGATEDEEGPDLADIAGADMAAR